MMKTIAIKPTKLSQDATMIPTTRRGPLPFPESRSESVMNSHNSFAKLPLSFDAGDFVDRMKKIVNANQSVSRVRTEYMTESKYQMQGLNKFATCGNLKKKR